jgi:hypothetical protein
MLKNCQLLFAASIALLLFAGHAFASDNGAKRNTTLFVENNFGAMIGVIVDADEDDLQEAADSEDPLAAFEELGGMILNDGQTAEFELKAGTHELFVVDGTDPTFNDTLLTDISLKKGETLTVSIVENAQGNPEIED